MIPGVLFISMDENTLPQTEEEWRGILTPEQFQILRRKGTERAFTGEYTDTTDAGTYRCAGCDEVLFSSEGKFHSGCGWPSFYKEIEEGKIEEHEDVSHGMRRVEVTCKRCGGHLGHVFPDGYGTPTGMRYCINSASLKFEPSNES
ncbi:MAG TPA: peptide-methionine (R)-S-oxide reductase MsrB [Fimbriimonas sp.]|nr:peptide-methionine (R)-S-oxide reductase MsrB [Fimbriimonas sp.]